MIPVARFSWRRISRRTLSQLVPPALLAGVVGCSESVGPIEVQESQDQIIFVSTRAGSLDEADQPLADIYRMNADGSDVERLTPESAAYKFLRLSPDGAKLVFYTDLGLCYDIWVMDTDGTDLIQLTGVAAYERCNEMPHWSPDGSKIAFHSSRQTEFGWDVYVMNADGAGVLNVSANPSTDYETEIDLVRGWSPDGRVALLSYRDGTPKMYLARVDGSGVDPLLAGESYVQAYWSPSGDRLLAMGEGDPELYLMSPDGSGVVNISNDPAYDEFNPWAPTPWSPDGEKVAFQSRRTGNLDAFVVNPDGSGLVNVSEGSGEDRFLDWSPDGTKLLLASDRGGDLDVYVVNADGTGLTNLTNSPGSDDGLAAIWMPHRQ
jgi:TolB protein